MAYFNHPWQMHRIALRLSVCPSFWPSVDLSCLSIFLSTFQSVCLVCFPVGLLVYSLYSHALFFRKTGGKQYSQLYPAGAAAPATRPWISGLKMKMNEDEQYPLILTLCLLQWTPKVLVKCDTKSCTDTVHNSPYFS